MAAFSIVQAESHEAAAKVRGRLAELRHLAEGVVVLDSDVLIAGYSGGASSAPYVAMSSDAFSAFAVLHGGVFAGGLGGRPIRGWFSTGDRDSIRTPSSVQAAAEAAREKGATTRGHARALECS